MSQARVGLSWVLILGAAAAFAFAVWSAALGNVRGFWAGFAVGLVFAWAGLTARRRASVLGIHGEPLAERGLLEDESDLALPEKPRPQRHYSGSDDDRPDIEDRSRR